MSVADVCVQYVYVYYSFCPLRPIYSSDLMRLKVTGYSYIRASVNNNNIIILCVGDQRAVYYTKTTSHNYSTTCTKYATLFFTSVFSQGIEVLTVYRRFSKYRFL